jgi:hypothetical protein
LTRSAIFLPINLDAWQDNQMRTPGIIFNGITRLLNLAFEYVGSLILTASAQ